MKRIISLVLISILLVNTSALNAKNVGVPAESEDVMLQAFYWDSYKNQSSTDSKYGRTKWVDLLKDTAAITRDFDLVWFPPSAFGEGGSKGGVGYIPKNFTDQNSDWGTKGKLTELINALHKGNVKVIADIVINHHGNSTSWCTFFADNFGQYGSFQLTQKHMCSNDEGFTDSKSSCYQAPSSERGAADSGTNFGGARDLDHTNEYVQNWSKAYLQWMLNEMNYDGFRYDMTLGFAGRYLQMYNESAQPYFSVSEYWEGIDKQVGHLKATDFNTMIFDFPLKYVFNNALRVGNYRLLVNPSNSLRGKGYGKYAVTFIDNHDTFERSDAQGQQFLGYKADMNNAENKNKILQANAYILMLPGIPCVFYPHWKSYQEEISALIAVRKKAGIHSESAVEEGSNNNVYEAKITGRRGTVIFRLGANRSKEAPEGYTVELEGGSVADYTIFYKEGAQGISNVHGNEVQGTKLIENGVLYLEYNGAKYNMQGMRVN